MTKPEQSENFHIQVNTPKTSAAGSIYRRKKTPWWQSPWAICGGLLVVAVLGWIILRPTPVENSATLSIADAKPMSIDEFTSWTHQPQVKGTGISKGSLRYRLIEAPHGVSVDERSGFISWQPTELQGPGDYKIGLEVSSGKLSAKTWLAITVNEVDQPPQFDLLPQPRLLAGETVDFIVTANDPDLPVRTIQYALENPLDTTARLDKATGQFQWTIPSDQSPGDYRFSIQAMAVGGSLSASEILTVTVKEPATPADPLVATLREQGASVSPSESQSPFTGLTGEKRMLLVNGSPLSVFRYPSQAAMQQDASKIQEDPKNFFGETLAENDPLHVFRSRDELAIYEGNHQQALTALQAHFGEPLASSPFASTSSLTEKPNEETPASNPDPEVLLTLYKRDRLATTDAYPILRKLFADQFAREHVATFEQAWGDDYREMMDWLDKRPEIREELFTALDPQHDQLPAALGLFNSLRKEFPDHIEDYAQLAIAVSVVWDSPRNSVVNYTHHASRTHSQMPTDLLAAADVFRYFVEAESWMQGRAKFLPWEFLIWMVNDRTPLAERKWAYKNYLSRRAQIGKCYKDVPYDSEMLRTSGQVCQLDGKDYVLPNIRQFGGVCAMQADFSSRVAKSLGVPAAYVSGESRGGELHAWVMWVELLDVNRNQIRFSLESYGRYRGDKYYVGTLRDAQTGQPMTDREMERELRVVGVNPKAKRHADLAVRALAIVDQQESLGVRDTMVTLLTILKLCPGHEPSWRKLAELAGSDEIDREERRMMVRALDSLFKTFAGFPDFTWKVFSDLTRYENDPRAKIQLYERLLKLYQAAGRPDLACEAALATADLLVEHKRGSEAVQSLSAIILRFADEGRYVPRMLDRMEEIYQSLGGSSADLVGFYQKLIPKIPPKRGDAPSPYAIEMYQRAIDCFKNNNQPVLANALAAKLTALKAGM